MTQDQDRYQFLAAAFSDAEGTIRATDTKASIALLVHGFIFTGMIGVLSHFHAFQAAGCAYRVAVVALVSLLSFCFLASVTFLLRCVAPAPKKVIPSANTNDLFHLPMKAHWLKGSIEDHIRHDTLKAQLEAATSAELLDEWTGELIKVSGIRARKTALARSGLNLLAVELGLAVALLLLLAAQQL